MSYQLVRMPTDNDELNRRMTEFAPFLDAMYTEHERELFGELDFSLA